MPTILCNATDCEYISKRRIAYKNTFGERRLAHTCIAAKVVIWNHLDSDGEAVVGMQQTCLNYTNHGKMPQEQYDG